VSPWQGRTQEIQPKPLVSPILQPCTALTRSLQLFLERVCRHPTLQRSQLLRSFLESTEWVSARVGIICTQTSSVLILLTCILSMSRCIHILLRQRAEVAMLP
jgi:hypothetical protein